MNKLWEKERKLATRLKNSHQNKKTSGKIKKTHGLLKKLTTK